MIKLLLRESFSALDDVNRPEHDWIEGIAKLNGSCWGECIIDDARPNLVFEDFSALFEHEVAASLSPAFGIGGKEFGQIFTAQVFRDFIIRLDI